jgi:hypothetical protein
MNFSTIPLDVTKIARVCHEVNRAYCQSIGDDSQPEWNEAPEWQKQSAIDGVKFRIAHPAVSPFEMHDNWWRGKVNDGWVYGPTKDVEKKEHPCMVPYNELPQEQKTKDFLFGQVVKSILQM